MSWKSKIKKKKRSILIQVTLMRNLSKIFAAFNPLTPRSDQQVTSPCDILTISDKTGNENIHWRSCFLDLTSYPYN